MRHYVPALLAIALIVAACGGSGGSAAPKSGLVDIGAGLQGPSGLTASVYATGLENVAAFAFDTDGRLWAGTASFIDEGSDGVYLVTQSGATPVEVIPDLHTVLGLLWYNGELYVASKERIDAYSGFDGTRFTEQRTVVQFAAGVGEVNGLALSPDGRLLLGISAPCNACVSESPYSGAIVSFLPDGSDLRVYASDIRASIALAYYPGTNDLFVTMNQRDDLGDATPGDWLAIVREGESWGFPDCYGQGGAVCDGVPQPVATLDAHAAVSGIAILTGQLGSNVGTSAIVAEWAKGVVLRVALQKDGTTYKSSIKPFITGIQNPVAVGLNGNALFVGDWTSGAIYKITA